MNKNDRMELFRNRIVELCNELGPEIGLMPEDAAAVMAQEGLEMLSCLSWTPHAQRAAKEHFQCAAAALVEGRVIPVPGFDLLFPEQGEGDAGTEGLAGSTPQSIQ